ncbi:MAG: DUF2059 domain-containing protein [Pseudomonadota bacterium]
MPSNPLRALAAVASLAMLAPAIASVSAQTARPAAVESAAEKPALVARLLEKARLGAAIEAWQEMLLSADSVPECDCDDDAQRQRFGEAWRTAVTAAFDARGIVAEFEAGYAAAFTTSELGELLAFFETPLGQKVGAIEREAIESEVSEAEALAGMVASMQALEAAPERKIVLKQLTARMGGEEAMVEMFVNLGVGAALGAAAATPAGRPRVDEATIVAGVEQGREELRKTLASAVIAQNAWMYRSLSLGELKQYDELYATPLWRRSTALSIVLFNRAMRRQALAIGARFAREWNAESL